MNENKAMISIIVPVYKVEKYLRQCLESILTQTYQNLEIILVDDGSPDSSGKICDEYADKYENFRVVHKQNAGLGMARNTGLEYASGEYVTFVDSDDWIKKDLIEKLYNGLTEYQVDLCKCGFQRVNDAGKVISAAGYQNELFRGSSARKELLPRMAGSSPSQHDSVEMCVCGGLYKTGIIRDNQIRFPSERELISEDFVFNIDYLQHADGACLIDSVGYQYRINQASLTRSYRPDRFEATVRYYNEISEKLRHLGYDSETLIRFTRMFFVGIRGCISQERGRVSHLPVSSRMNHVKMICDNETLKNAIKMYPVDELGFRQKIFLKLIQGKRARLLFLLAEAGNL